MPRQTSDVGDGERCACAELALDGEVVILVIRRFVVELDAAERESGAVYERGIERNRGETGFERGIAAIGVLDRRDWIRRGEAERVLEGVVVAETRITASIFECAVVDAVSGANDPPVSSAERDADARRDVGGLHVGETGAVTVGVDELDAVLLQKLLEAGGERGIVLARGGNEILGGAEGIARHEVGLGVVALAGGAEPFITRAEVER